MSVFDRYDRFPPRVSMEASDAVFHPNSFTHRYQRLRDVHDCAASGCYTRMPQGYKPMRIAIIGWPGTGKTTLGKQLAEDLKLPYHSTDEVISLGWSEASLEVSTWLDAPEWIIEGVALPRAFRKWRANHPGEPCPVDRLVHLTQNFRDLKPGEVSMGKGIDTVLKELDGWLPAPVEHNFFMVGGTK